MVSAFQGVPVHALAVLALFRHVTRSASNRGVLLRVRKREVAVAGRARKAETAMDGFPELVARHDEPLAVFRVREVLRIAVTREAHPVGVFDFLGGETRRGGPQQEDTHDRDPADGGSRGMEDHWDLQCS